MDTKQLRKFEVQIRSLLKLPENDLRVIDRENVAIVAISGERPGRRPEYAWRRRRRWMDSVRRVGRRLAIDINFDFSGIDDALKEMEEAGADWSR